MKPDPPPYLPSTDFASVPHITRRHFFSRCGIGLGSIALASLLSEQRLFAADAPKLVNPLAPKPPHFPARAKNVIFLFMAGGPSQLELFDYKPKLIELNGQPIPQSFIEGKRFAFMGTRDRKSTGLNSSHRCISDAVFCLKKKKTKTKKR